MRTTRGKPTYDRVLLGDRQLAEAMADALALEERRDRYTHGFHAYPAGLHPDAARDLVALFPGESVLDPFCGGGTVLVEAIAAGRRAVGRDLSTTALRVATARTCVGDEAFLTRVRSRARKLTAEAREATELPPHQILQGTEEWYAPYVLCELESLRRGIQESDEDLKPILWALFSTLLVKVSWRRSDTSAQRVKHHRPPGTAAILFHKKAREYGRQVASFRDAVPEGTPAADVRAGDARNIQGNCIGGHTDEPGLRLLMRAVSAAPALEELSLAHNCIDGEGAELVAGMIEEHRRLRSLDLSSDVCFVLDSAVAMNTAIRTSSENERWAC